ncbi:MAG: glycosyltransferase family 2 protein [Clostridia bacterium]|nr:glycosyltransferase family 2 protein [Clostridia bacterium]
MKLSIIIPVYNKIRYLATLLRQVQTQTFTDYECLLIDDGSIDGSGAVCDEFAAQDARFRVFHIPNGGVSHARNVGLDAAQGNYVTFIDADDGVKPDYLERLLRCIEESGADLVISGYEKVADDGHTLQIVMPDRSGIVYFSELLPDFARTQLKTGEYGYCWAKMFPRQLVKNIRFDEGLKLAEDFDFYLHLYAIVDTVCLDGTAGYRYLQDAENSTGNTASEKIDYLAQLRIYLHYREMLQKREAYMGENRTIVEGRLSDYAYFVLFHTPLPQYKERFEQLKHLCHEHEIPLTGTKLLRKWLFCCLRNHQHQAAEMTMRLYRAARRQRNGGKET